MVRVVKDVDTGGWGARDAIFCSLKDLTPDIFTSPRASEAVRCAAAPGVDPLDGSRLLHASGLIKIQGSGQPRARGVLKL